MRDIGTGGNDDGIKLSGVDSFTVEDCLIESWGAWGSAIDMVGCHGGVIRGCVLRNGGLAGGTGVQAKGGSAGVVVRDNRFESAGVRAVQIGGSTGKLPLETLSGIGEVLAATIVEYREQNGPFASVDDLEDVSGIGPATLEEIRDQVTV